MKQAQDGGGAAVLLLIIGAFVLIYLLLLPEGDRNELLDEGNSDDNEDTVTGKLLLNKTPGLLLEEDDDNIKHNLGSVSVFIRTNEAELERLNPFTVSSAQDRFTKVIALDVAGETSNAQLTFDVVKGEGLLYILLDGEEVFRGSPSGQVTPIALEGLRSDSIVIVGVDSVSFLQFWRENEYELANLKITGTLDQFDAQDSTTSFVVTDSELERAESGYITYFTNCAGAETVRSGQLSVHLNSQQLFSGLPDCDSPVRLEIVPSDLIAGRNSLSFSTDAGSYILDRIVVTTEVIEGVPIAYTFNLNKQDFSRAESETDDVKVYFSFVDNNERKSAELVVNSATFTIDTRKANFTQSIPSFSLKEGSNFISISPKSTFALPLLEVRLS